MSSSAHRWLPEIGWSVVTLEPTWHVLSAWAAVCPPTTPSTLPSTTRATSPAAILRPIVSIRSPLDVPPSVPTPGTGAIRPPTPEPPVPEVLDEAVRTLGYGHEREARRLPVQGRVDLFEGASAGWEQGP